MKKRNKFIIGSLIVVALVVGIQQGLKYYLQGPPKPFNALLISGDIESVNSGKNLYKDNTKYTKDYQYKTVTNFRKVLDENGEVVLKENGEEWIGEFNFLVITKETAKEMLKDQVLRLKDSIPGSIETTVLESIPNIDTNKAIYFGSEDKNKKLEINGENIPLEYGSYSWIGYYPSEQGELIITDDETYKSIEDEEKTMSLIRFNKGKKDLRDIKDKEKIDKELLKTGIIEINYADVKN